MQPLRRRVQYYETDQMGIAHHAHYIRWMEEARIGFLDQLGFPYRAMEEQGVLSPVKAVSCQYLKPCRFYDEIDISVSVASFNGVVLALQYEMKNAATGETVCTARSEHVFLDREGRFVRLKRVMPDFYAAVDALCPNPDKPEEFSGVNRSLEAKERFPPDPLPRKP